MVRPVESIRKDLDALEGATAALAEEFSQIYATYLTVLGQAMRRQVIMASYHLCTQVYPEEFLALAVSDRARLQQALQALGRKAQGWLQQIMEPDLTPSDGEPQIDPDDLNRLEAALSALVESAAESDAPAEIKIEIRGDQPPATASGQSASMDDEDESEDGQSSPQTSEANPTLADLDASAVDPRALMKSVIMAAMASDVEETFTDRPFTGDPLTPILVAKHHLILEQMIRQVLQRVSKKANQVLRKAQLIPDLPEPVLEAATDADVPAARGRAAPNVVNVLVAMAGDMAAEFGSPDPELDNPDLDNDVEDSEEDEEAVEGTMTHLAAVQLRVTDLEFGDVQSALWRSKLRTVVGKLRKVGKQYQRAERELAIAQAEQAWRAVWYDDASR